MENTFNPKKLTEELQAANLPVSSVSSDGRVDYTRALNKTEAAFALAIIEAHDPKPTDQEIERDLLAKASISMQDLLMALWAQAAHGDAGAVNALAEKIDLALDGM